MNFSVIVSFLLIGLCLNAPAQTCNPDSIEIRTIKAFTTSNLIDWELQNHQVFINPDCSPKQ